MRNQFYISISKYFGCIGAYNASVLIHRALSLALFGIEVALPFSFCSFFYSFKNKNCQ